MQEDVVLCLKDVLLFSQDRDKKLGEEFLRSSMVFFITWLNDSLISAAISCIIYSLNSCTPRRTKGSEWV